MRARRGRSPARGAGAVVWAAAATPVAAITLSLPGSGTGPALGPPPDLPRQPGIAAPACTPPPSSPDSWTQVASFAGRAFGTGQPPGASPEQQLTIDPWQPCHMYRADTADTLQRSSDSGHTWQNVFHDDASGYRTLSTTPAPFHMQDVDPVAPGHVVLAESANGDGVVSSADAGAHWTLTDSGIGGEPVTRVVSGGGGLLYAVTAPPPPTGPLAGGLYSMYVSRDGGASWSAGTLPRLPDLSSTDTSGLGSLLVPVTNSSTPPCGSGSLNPCTPPLQLQPDPGIPGHVYLMVPVNSNEANQTLMFESNDAGQTWSPLAPISGQYTQLLVTRTASHGLRLYLVNYNPNIYGQATDVPLRSDNDGKEWAPIPVDRNMGFVSLAADPANPDLMLYAGMIGGYVGSNTARSKAFVYWSYDGFDTSTPGAALPGFDMPFPLVPALVGAYSADSQIALQADRYGTFYVGLRDECIGDGKQPPCMPGAPRNTLGWYDRQSWWRYTPPTQPKPRSLFGSDSISQQAPPPSGTAMQELRDCKEPVSGSRAGGIDYGSLTFDGADLLYTQYGDMGPALYQGLIHRTNPQTCADDGTTIVTFDPADLQKVAQVTKEPDTAVHPYVDTLTYDPNHNVIWLSLASGNAPLVGNPANGGFFGAGPNVVGVFSATYVGGANGPRRNAVARLRFTKPHCSGNFGEGLDMFAYDFTDDTIWGCDARPSGQPPPPPLIPGLPVNPLGGNDTFSGMTAHLHLDGSLIPSCESTDYDQLATWVVGGRNRLYIQSEDDTTVFEADASTCKVLSVMHHRNFNEPLAEDEQMACDSITFGVEAVAAGSTPLTKPTSVIWLRDATAGAIVAYAVPDSSCPYPTVTTLAPPAPVMRGQVATLCATLVHRGVTRPLLNEPLDFTVAGHYAGRGYTDGGGVACTGTFVGLPAGTYPVTVAFGGNFEYLPSSDSGSVGVSVPAMPGENPPVLPPALIPNGTSPPPPQQANPQPVTNPNPATQPQTQSQGQQQAQGQSQAQANLQPGFVAQEQEQVQVQVAPAALPDEQQLGYAMSSADQGNLEQAMGLAGGAALAVFVAAGVAWALRAPGAALAATRSRRRRQAPRRWLD
jgi:hypothetical protein